MPANKNVTAGGGDSSGEDEISVDKVVETKRELDKIRKERENKRARLQADLDEKLDDLRARIRQGVTAHVQQLGDNSQQQVTRLLQAIEARDAFLQAISDKLTETQDVGRELAMYLEGAYEYRANKAKLFPMPAEGQTGHQGKKAKVEDAQE